MVAMKNFREKPRNWLLQWTPVLQTHLMKAMREESFVFQGLIGETREATSNTEAKRLRSNSHYLKSPNSMSRRPNSKSRGRETSGFLVLTGEMLARTRSILLALASKSKRK